MFFIAEKKAINFLISVFFTILFLLLMSSNISYFENLFSFNGSKICFAQSPNKIWDKYGELKIDESRMRDLSSWNPRIKKYSRRHYGEDTYVLKPTVIVLHYTALPDFPWLLSKSKSAMNEEPGLASHYVIDENTVWRILPDTVRSRGCWGLNHRAINIEMCALNASDLKKKKKTLKSCARLVKHLMHEYNIPLKKIYSHEDVAKMDKRLTPEVKDLVNGTPYDKYDPGSENMKYIKKFIREME